MFPTHPNMYNVREGSMDNTANNPTQVTTDDGMSVNIQTVTSCETASLHTIAINSNIPAPCIKWTDRHIDQMLDWLEKHPIHC